MLRLIQTCDFDHSVQGIQQQNQIKRAAHFHILTSNAFNIFYYDGRNRAFLNSETVQSFWSKPDCVSWFRSGLKGIVHPKMKISQRFTHPQGILCVSDIPLSDKHMLSYIPHCLVCSNLYNCSELCPCFWIRKKSIRPSQNYSTRLRGVNKDA